MECEQPDDDPNNSDDEMKSPLGIVSAMPNCADNAKDPVNQHPGAEQHHQHCDCQARIGERDYSEYDCSYTP